MIFNFIALFYIRLSYSLNSEDFRLLLVLFFGLKDVFMPALHRYLIVFVISGMRLMPYITRLSCVRKQCVYTQGCDCGVYMCVVELSRILWPYTVGKHPVTGIQIIAGSDGVRGIPWEMSWEIP